MEEKLIINLHSIYVGIEHSYKYDDIGNTLDVKSIHPYVKLSEFNGDDNSRIVYLNLETGDKIRVNQDGIAIGSDSTTADIKDISFIKSFHEIISTLLDREDEVIDQLEYGKDAMDYVKSLDDFMTNFKEASMDFSGNERAFDNYIRNINNLYILAYDSPLQKKPSARNLRLIESKKHE